MPSPQVKGDQRDKLSKPPFGEFLPRCVFDRARSLAPVSFFGPVYSPSSALRPRSARTLQGVLSCRYPHFISRESFSLFSGSFRAVYRPKYARFLPPTLHSYSRYSDEYSFHMKCPACSSLSYTGNLDNLLHSALSSKALSEVCR